MKTFFSRTLLFSMPLFLLLLGVEVLIRIVPNSFSRKADYLHTHLNNIEVLILGSSHSQDAINPENLSRKASNLAYGGQDVTADAALFFKHVQRMPKLRHLVLELDYHTLETKMERDNYRIPWYYIYYQVELQKLSMLNKQSLFSSSPAFFSIYMIMMATNPQLRKLQLNEQGFLINDQEGYFQHHQFDSSKILSTASERLASRHAETSEVNYWENRKQMDAVINYCKGHGIKVTILTHPAFRTYVQNQVGIKNERKKQYLDSLKNLSFVQYHDFESDQDFLITDFKNDDHLNSSGAEKFTRKINQLLQ